MCPTLFEYKDTKQVETYVRELFKAMTPAFREHLMHSFMWTEDKLDKYLQRDGSLKGDELKDAYSHLESLLARIESFSADKPKKAFPTYDEWVDKEYRKYKAERSEDIEDIQRLMDEGGVVSPGKTSPVDTMANDSLAHYNHLKSEYETLVSRSKEAGKLMLSPPYKGLQVQAETMQRAIMAEIVSKRL